MPCKWDLELFKSLLTGYEDQEVITLLKYGWPIDVQSEPVEVVTPPNQKGARENFQDVEDYISKELKQQSIIGPCGSSPFVKARVSPIDAIPKKDASDKRIILNLSYPDGKAVNDYFSKICYLGKNISLKYPTVDSLIDLILEVGTGAALFKTDLKKYYRQIYYDPGSVHLAGFKHGSNFYWDITLSMGLRIACFIAQRVSDALMYIYRNRFGYHGVNYIDDLAGTDKWSRAMEAYRALISLLKDLRIWESEHKDALLT